MLLIETWKSSKKEKDNQQYVLTMADQTTPTTVAPHRPNHKPKEIHGKHRTEIIHFRASPDTVTMLNKIKAGRKSQSLAFSSTADVFLIAIEMYYHSIYGDE